MSTSFRTGAGLALLCAGIGVTSWFAFNARSIDTSPTTTIEDVPDRFVEILTESPPPAAGETALSAPDSNPDAGEGARAKQEEGKVGKKDAKGSGAELQRQQQDRELAASAGQLGALSGTGDVGGGIGGLIGAQGTQLGSGGLGSRGSGLGGGGTAEGLGGLGTKGRGSGSSGYGSGGGTFGSGRAGQAGQRESAVHARLSTKGASTNSGQSAILSTQGAFAQPEPEQSREGYTDYGTNEMTLVEQDAQSTFSVDVDTASYTIARRKLQEGSLPPEAAVRVEEFVNFFDYTYVKPRGSEPFSVNMEAAPSPWTPNRHILRVGIQGRELSEADRKPARLTFLVDVSGSMGRSDKLPLAQRALRDLVKNLDEEDSVAIATYAGRTEVLLPPTAATERETIFAAIDRLTSGGGTNMDSGVQLAYTMADAAFVSGAENRVVVLSDGDANIGRTSHDALLTEITGYAKKGITLSTIGFGTGNYQDTLMEQLANKGDGNYFYIDSFDEARRVFGQDLAGTIQTIARDVKIQVEFDPAAVSAYRLIGYENRDIADQDFRNDKVDAGEVGSGHQVTALYEVVLRDGYESQRLATVRLRAKPPGPDKPAEEWQTAFPGAHVKDEVADASRSFRLALGTATFAEKLRASPHVEELTYAQILALLGDASTAELTSLIQQAASLSGERSVATR